MTVHSNFVTIKIGGADVSNYILSYTRNDSLCNPGQTFTLHATRKKPSGAMFNVGVSSSVEITEKYGTSTKVLKGFVTKVDVDANDANMIIKGSDKYILLKDYFIEDRLETSGQSVGYWIEYICGLVDLDVTFETSANTPTSGGDGEGGTPLGMQRAIASIQVLEQKGAVYTRYDSATNKIIVYRPKSSEPQIHINSSELTDIERNVSTKDTRNVVKVWGTQSYDWITQETHTHNAIARANMDELIVDKTIVMSSPEVTTTMFASIIASRILAVTATLDDKVICECAGLYPNIEVTDYASISISQGKISYYADRQITAISVSVGDGGALTSFTFGDKCPRLAFVPPLTYIYLGAKNGGGVGVSFDSGDSFINLSEGLEGNSLEVTSVAANCANQLMCITAAGIYRRYGIYGTWFGTDLPEPIITESGISITASGMYLHRIVAEPNKYNVFHFLAQASGLNISGMGINRWWVYYTRNFGYTWESQQLFIPSGYTTISGVINTEDLYDVNAYDITSSATNEVDILISSKMDFESDPYPDTDTFQSFYWLECFPPDRRRLLYAREHMGYIYPDNPASGYLKMYEGYGYSQELLPFAVNNSMLVMNTNSQQALAFTRYYPQGTARTVKKTSDGGDTWASLSMDMYGGMYIDKGDGGYYNLDQGCIDLIEDNGSIAKVSVISTKSKGIWYGSDYDPDTDYVTLSELHIDLNSSGPDGVYLASQTVQEFDEELHTKTLNCSHEGEEVVNCKYNADNGRYMTGSIPFSGGSYRVNLRKAQRADDYNFDILVTNRGNYKRVHNTSFDFRTDEEDEWIN